MTFQDLAAYFATLPDVIMNEVPDIVAETAVEYFKESFDKKSFNGNPWAPAKKPRSNGSLLVDSGTLVNSIEPRMITPERVIISAGHTKAPYAMAHNEGYTGSVRVEPFTRTTEGRSVDVPTHTRKGKTIKAHTWNIPGGEQQVKAFTRKMNLPQRQFMGMSDELNQLIRDRIEKRIQSRLNI